MPSAPAPVTAAAVVTWVTATGIGLFGTLFLLVLGPAAAGILDTFADDGDLSGRAVVAITVAAWWAAILVADVLAALVVRRHRWAAVALGILSVLVALVGLLSAYAVVPLVLTAAGTAVLVLLLHRESRAWLGGRDVDTLRVLAPPY